METRKETMIAVANKHGITDLESSPDGICLSELLDEQIDLKPNDIVICNFEIISGYRLATDEDRKLPKTEDYYFINKNAIYEGIRTNNNYKSEFTYLIPIEPPLAQGEALIKCLCGVSDESLDKAKMLAASFDLTRRIAEYSDKYNSYIDNNNMTWKYAYPCDLTELKNGELK